MAMSDNKMADTGEKIFIGKGEQPAWLTLALGNRHGLVTGATGTGKNVSLQVMAGGCGRGGHPVRATLTEMAPLLLSRILDLNDVQEGVLNVAFRVADDNGMALIDMKDLRALLDAIVPNPANKGADGGD